MSGGLQGRRGSRGNTAAAMGGLKDELLKAIWHAFTALDLDHSGKVSKSQLKVGAPPPRVPSPGPPRRALHYPGWKRDAAGGDHREERAGMQTGGLLGAERVETEIWHSFAFFLPWDSVC